MENNFFTKKDFENFTKKLILPLKEYYSDGKAELKYGEHSSYKSEKTQKTEAFIRPLWGLAPLFAGGGECEDFDKIYLQGITNGTDPIHPEYFGRLTSCSQELCESPALALSLVLAKEKLWEPLTEKQKNNVANWLFGANGLEHADNNWTFFPLLVNVCLKKLGRKYSQETIDGKLEIIDGFYRGDGWYSDGKRQRFEYYVPFALHFYGLIYAKLMENEDPSRCRIFKERAMLFAKHYIYFFDDDGREIPFGRSLTYRFAHLAFWSACLFADIEPYPVEVIKGIIARNLRWWSKQPICDNKGILTVGYCYNMPSLAEGYTCFGSPYWCMKSMLILALDDNHPFWSAKEAPMPKLDAVHIMKQSSMVIQRIDGVAYLLPTGQDGGWENHSDEKYSKFAYSSKDAFCIPISYQGIGKAGADSMLMFEKDGYCFPRRKCIEYKVNDDASLYSKWSPFEGVIVETTVIPTKDGHIRKHSIESDGEYIAYDFSFATEQGKGDVSGNGEMVEEETMPNLNLYTSKPLKMKGIKYTIPKGKSEFETKVIYP